MPSVSQATESYIQRSLPSLLVITALISVMPLSESYWLGNSGKLIMTHIEPILLALSSGLVCVSLAFLSILMYPFQWLSSYTHSQKRYVVSTLWWTKPSNNLNGVLLFIFIRQVYGGSRLAEARLVLHITYFGISIPLYSMASSLYGDLPYPFLQLCNGRSS